jgi:hypothetical protein
MTKLILKKPDSTNKNKYFLTNWHSMTKQIRHWRTSQYGKKFPAGSRVPEIEEESKENIFDIGEDKEIIEIPEDDMEKIKKVTKKSESEILGVALEIGSSEPTEIIEILKEGNETEELPEGN